MEPITVKLPFNQTLHSFPLPGSGVVLGFIMNILNGFLDMSQPNLISNWQRIVESFKYGYAKRTELGDRTFVEGIDNVSIERKEGKSLKVLCVQEIIDVY